MSYTRNPKNFDTRTKSKNGNKPIHKERQVTATEVNKYLSRIKNILKKHRWYDRNAKNNLRKELDMVKYLCSHSHTTSFNKDEKLLKAVELVEGIKGIDTSDLKELVTYKKY